MACNFGTLPQIVESTSMTSAEIGKPFSNDFLPSRNISSETSPKLKYNFPPLWYGCRRNSKGCH
jgi:hypothetical protein